MSSLAFYLKYRPQSLDEVVGQDHVKKTLQDSFKTNKLSHAYLFCGPRGTGKTSTARILAKMVNCSADKKVPCNECPTCLSITDGSNLDLIEIDAASNRGIEDIRSLREKIKLAPTSSKKKVYIFDETHMLTTEAFNALLKTLEEPPSHALFILATTDFQKIPQTIQSRSQRLDFRLASLAELREALKRIVDKEKINIDEEALKLVAKKAEGSFRDGVKLLDQLSSFEGKITHQVLQKLLKSTNFEVLFELIQTFGKKDPKAALSLVLQQMDEGVDSKELILSLMDMLRNLVLIKNGLGEELVKENMLEEDYQNLIKLSEDFENKDLVSFLDILQKALIELKIASIPSLPLELAVVEICSLPPQFGEPIQKLESSKLQKPEETETKDAQINHSSDTGNGDIQKLKEKWTFVLETVRAFNFSLEALLRSISIAQCTKDSLIMEVPYTFHQRIIDAPKNRELLESVFSDILGRGIHVSTVLGIRPQRKEDIQNIEVAADDEIIRAAAEIFNSDSVN